MSYLKSISCYIIFALLVVFSATHVVYAQAADGQIIADKTDIVRAVVISIDKTEKGELEFIDVPQEKQTLTAKLLSGDNVGKEVQIENDTLHLNVGDKFFAYHTTSSDYGESYTVSDPDRLGPMLFFIILFIVILFIFGGKQGVRALVSLIGSLALILYVLFPAIMR